MTTEHRDTSPSTFQSLQNMANRFFRSLTEFSRYKGLEDILMSVSVDHIAIKTENSTEYEQVRDQLRDMAWSVSEVNLSGRRIAVAHLKQEIQLGSLGNTHWLEIMEPKPDSAKPKSFFDHIEVVPFSYIFSLQEIKEVLEQEGVSYQEGGNQYHQSVVVVINELGQEIKFTDKPLGEIVTKQLRNGTATLLTINQ